ncbi:metaxin-1-like [Photinus pyralis]|uniref:metaxin-1-like n=1 Tax=Photinus pyralis TaxID=7054 RepID=UPI00126735D5|nr:metaxin-1-like [Photinus pyralis]
MELFVWDGDFGLVSLHCDCIRVIAYAILTNAPVKVVFCRNPCYDYPILRTNSEKLVNYGEIVRYLQNELYILDAELDEKQESESYVFLNMLTLHLKPVLEYLHWLNDTNYETFMRMWYAKVIPIPLLNCVYPARRRRSAQEFFESLYPHLDRGAIEVDLLKKAQDCFFSLSTRLEKKPYFHGSSPTTIDTAIFAYLALIAEVPLPSNPFANMIKVTPTLCQFIRRFKSDVFPGVEYDSKYLNRVSCSIKENEDEDLSTSLTAKIVIVGVTLCGMFVYAVCKNLVDLGRLNSFVLIGEK